MARSRSYSAPTCWIIAWSNCSAVIAFSADFSDMPAKRRWLISARNDSNLRLCATSARSLTFFWHDGQMPDAFGMTRPSQCGQSMMSKGRSSNDADASEDVSDAKAGRHRCPIARDYADLGFEHGDLSPLHRASSRWARPVGTWIGASANSAGLSERGANNGSICACSLLGPDVVGGVMTMRTSGTHAPCIVRRPVRDFGKMSLGPSSRG